ncbi:hypothetical protein BDW02DRAFT_623613 [Decorospora gaudefroyi]|uniref:Uncharacterized protein n=1 Tax=Decorospora gaudefroyi TaxID=184978 RepID=A0A6A5KDL6_9PLEO|nr:hypothetical protein BDW02DRAFT_623613 [Decorospora gaudefroyi]
MTVTNSTTASSASQQSKPLPAARGQGTTKAARARRRKAAKNQAALPNNETVSSKITDIPNNFVNAMSSVKLATSSLAVGKGIITSEGDLARSESAAKMTHPVKNIVPEAFADYKIDKNVQKSRQEQPLASPNVSPVATPKSSDSWVVLSVAEATAKTSLQNDALLPQHVKEASLVVELQHPPTLAVFPATLSASSSSQTKTTAKGSYANAIKSPSSSMPGTPVSSAAQEVTTSSAIADASAATTTDVPPQSKNLSDPNLPDRSSTVVDQPFDNLLLMIRQQRLGLLKGPRITIHVGDTIVEGVSKRVAMAGSSVLHKHFIKNPKSLKYRFSQGQIHPGAVRLLLKTWMEPMCEEFEGYAVPAQTTFAANVAVLRAARLLGMERYCSHILAEYVHYLKTQLPSYEEIVEIESNATSAKDPLWTTMVNHLCHVRSKGLIPDFEDFEAFLEAHPRLQKAMDLADEYFSGYAKKQREARETERRQQYEAREAERHQRWKQNQAETRQRIAQEQQAAASLKKKLDAKGGGLMTVTADEAEMLRQRLHIR